MITKRMIAWNLMALVAFSSGLSAGQDSTLPERLTLERAIALGLQNHPRIERSRHEVQAAEASTRGARAQYYPWVSVQGIAKDGLPGAAGGLDLVGLPGSPFFDKVAIAVNVNFTAYDFGRTGNQVDKARFTTASLRSREEAARAGIVWRVKTAYYHCLQAEELTRVARETLEERKLTARAAQVYYDANLRSKLDANLSQVNVKEAEAELVRAENQGRSSYAALNFAMGVAGRATYELEPAPADRPFAASPEGLIEKALASRPDLQAVNLEVQAEVASVNAARSERYPHIAAVASVGRARFPAELDGDQWLVGVGLNVPLFTGFALESRIDRAQAKLEAAEALRKELVQQVRYEVQKTYMDLETARALALATEARASLAEETLRLASQMYGAQLGSLLDVTQAELALARSKLQQVQAQYDIMITASTLEFVLGEGVGDVPSVPLEASLSVN
jgi:outer membrane protein TolC